MRIQKHPILEFRKGRKITFYFENQPIEAYEDEPIAVALIASRIYVFRESLKLHRPRGLFCAIGKCSSCLVEVDGRPNIRACITPVREGMRVSKQKGRGRVI